MRLRLALLAAVALLLCPALASAQMVVHTVAVTTDSSGDATVYSPPTFGTVVAIRYVPHASTPLDDAADLTFSDNGTGLGVLTVTNMGPGARDFWPRAFTMSTTGTAATFDGTNSVLDMVPVAGAVKVVVASGGATKSGTLYIYVQGR